MNRPGPDPGEATDGRADTILDDLDAGRRRAAWPDPTAPDGWRVDAEVKAAILGRFADRTLATWETGPFGFADRVGLPLKRLLDGPDAVAARAAGRPWRIVPGGTSIRAGVHLEPGVVVMPPSYLNVGAWVGEDTMIDSHVLVGSCAQIGARVHLAAGVQVGGVLEPPGARPVIIENDVFVGADSVLVEGVLVSERAVIGAGVSLNGSSRVYDLVRHRILEGSSEAPLVIPTAVVVVPGVRAPDDAWARGLGLGIATALIVKDRDPGTDARVALERALR